MATVSWATDLHGTVPHTIIHRTNISSPLTSFELVTNFSNWSCRDFKRPSRCSSCPFRHDSTRPRNGWFPSKEVLIKHKQNLNSNHNETKSESTIPRCQLKTKYKSHKPASIPPPKNFAPTFPWIDNCLMVTKQDFLNMEASLRLNKKPRVSLKIGCLPNAVGKQPSLPLIDLGRKWILSWWWQYFFRASICSCKWNELQLTVIFLLAHLVSSSARQQKLLALVVSYKSCFSCSFGYLFPFKSLQVQQSSYYATLIPRYVSMRSLWSSSSFSIYVPTQKNRNGKVQSQSFSSVASDIWNKLLCHLSSIPAFTKRLNYHLFSSALFSISSPSGNITLCDVTPFINVPQVRNIMQPS